MKYLPKSSKYAMKYLDKSYKNATSRSRNIWFHLVIQSYMQIDLVYSPATSAIICDNCDSQIFLGAQNRKTKEIFSNECGKHNIPALRTKLETNNKDIIELPVVNLSDLENINPGHMFIKRRRMPIILSQYIRSYICAQQGVFNDFTDGNGLITCTPTNFKPFSSKQFTYQKLLEKIDYEIDKDSDIDY